MPLTTKEREFWNILKYGYDRNKVLSGNLDLNEYIKISQKLNKVVEPLAYYIYNVCKKIVIKEGYASLEYKDDMVHHAFRITIQSILKFNTNKSDNPFAFIVTCCNSGCINYITKERKETKIKKDLRDAIKHDQAII